MQGAVYFGMDEVITKCENWVDSEMCNMRWGTEDGFLSDLLSIWSTATENGLDLFQNTHEFQLLFEKFFDNALGYL